LAAFLASVPARQAEKVLRTSGTQIRQLRAGEIDVPPRMLERWLAHQASHLLPAAPWQVRKVDAEGAVWLAGRRYGSPAMLPRVGQQVIAALLADGRLTVAYIALDARIVADPLPDD